METIERIIAEHSFFAGLNQDLVHIVTGCASNVRFDAGTYVFKEGDEANAFYLIREGTVALEILAPQNPILVDTLGDGDILGWSWLLPPFHWRFNAHARTGLRAIALDGKCLRTKCEENHDLGYELLKRFARIVERRLDALRSHLIDVYGEELPPRHSKSPHIRAAEGGLSDLAAGGHESDFGHKKSSRGEEQIHSPSAMSR